MWDLDVGHSASRILRKESVLRRGISDDGQGGAAVAVLGADHDDAMGGHGACYVGVCVSGAAEAVGEDHGGPSAIGYVFGLEKRGILVDGDGSIVNVSWEEAIVDPTYLSVKAQQTGCDIRRPNIRDDLRGQGPKAQELGVGGDMVPLGGREPCYSLALGVRLSWIVDAEKHGVDVGCLWGRVAGGFEVGDGYLDIDSADLVGAGVLWQGRHGVDLVQVVCHLLRVGGPLRRRC